jgi:hypothetical protein
MSEMIEVYNLASGQSLFYTCGNFRALLNAYATEKKDGNSFDYETKYGNLVELCGQCLTLGDWTTLIPAVK